MHYKQNSAIYKFNSFSSGCTALRNIDIAIPAYSTIAVIPDFIDEFEYSDDLRGWYSLRSLLIW